MKGKRASFQDMPEKGWVEIERCLVSMLPCYLTEERSRPGNSLMQSLQQRAGIRQARAL